MKMKIKFPVELGSNKSRRGFLDKCGNPRFVAKYLQ